MKLKKQSENFKKKGNKKDLEEKLRQKLSNKDSLNKLKGSLKKSKRPKDKKMKPYCLFNCESSKFINLLNKPY